MGKGFLAVRLAQNFILPPQIQALCGVAAVIGHNWSCFLEFAGGRGIGTLGGAFLALSPKILGFSIIPFAVLGIIWNLSIGTLLFLVSSLALSFHFHQLPTVGLLTVASLPPIFIKRLSPIEEIKKAQNKNKISLIKNRLIYDNDNPPPELRIKKIIRKLTKK